MISATHFSSAKIVCAKLQQKYTRGTQHPNIFLTDYRLLNKNLGPAKKNPKKQRLYMINQITKFKVIEEDSYQFAWNPGQRYHTLTYVANHP